MARSKKTTLGVDIGLNEVRIVSAARISSDRWKLLECASIPFDPGISRGDSRFHEFLRSCLSSIAGPAGKCDVWTRVSAASTDLRYIKIPKVPKAQIPNAVYWTLKREVNFNENESIVDFEVHGEVLEKDLVKIGIMAYIVPRKDLDEIRDLFSRSGLTICGVTATPFAIQNLFRSACIPRHEKPVGVLFIGNEYSRIDVFSKGNLILTREMKAGMDSMVEAFVEEASEETWKAAKEVGNGYATTFFDGTDNKLEEARSLLEGFFSGSSGFEELSGLNGAREEAIFETIKPALGRLARQVERSIEHSSAALGDERVETIYVSCAAGYWMLPFRFIAEQLGVEREVLDPIGMCGMESCEISGHDTIAERVSFTVATGLAVSDKVRTPNLILTYRDKEELGKIARINRWIFYVFITIILVLTGVFSLQTRLAGQKEAEITRLQRELDGYNPQATQAMIAALASKAISRQRSLAEQSSRLLAPAVIGELAALTPSNVRLLSVRFDLGGKPDETDRKSVAAGVAKEGPDVKKEAKKGVMLEGIVTGKRDTQEASLAGYVMKLSRSRLFVAPVVSSNTPESYPEEGDVLRFSLQMGMP